MNGLSPRRAWAAAALAAAVLYFCFFSRLDAFGVIGPDEPRYASIAREMAETGDWVTPRLNGLPWFEKPALYYWGAAAAFRLFGVSEFSARLPSALSAALAALALAWLAGQLYGAGSAAAVLLIFPTCVGVFAFARAGTTDMPFSASLAMAMVCASRVVGSEQNNSRWRWQLLFGATLGIAALAKGPAALVLAGGSAGLWALLARDCNRALRLAHPLAVTAFCLVALPWYVLCAMRNPEFLSVFLLSHNVERYLTPVFQHVQPVWFYGPILLLGLMPWSALLVGLARDASSAVRAGRWRQSPGCFFACWVVVPVLFFSLSKSKLPGYVLPVFAPLVLLMARSVTRAMEQRDAFAQWMLEWTGVTLLVLAGSTGYWLRRYPAQLETMTRLELTTGIVAVMAAGLIVSGLAWTRKLWPSLILASLLMSGLIEGVNRRFAPALDAQISPREVARIVQSQDNAAGEVAVYRLHRAWHYGLNFYLRREVPAWRPGAGRKREIVVTSAAGAQELEAAGMKFAVVERVSRQAVILRGE